ncbi:MAG: hypothetical protein KKG01_07325 [Candidatus Omnitrophica bacterium]|nr:hypothetical protein [Candidatus Omnitrophota bacterium]
MSEKLKGLLEKINQEGVKQAEEKAGVIETKARADAEKILRDAKIAAQKIIEDARTDAKKTKLSGETAIKQASRDLILALKDEIKKIFNKIVNIETIKAMSQENLAEILGELVENYIEKDGKTSDVKVLLKKEDLEKLKKSSISRLKDKLKDGIEFKPSPSINAGFSISFDKGKSFFDFTDEGLTDALCAYLNPELAKLLK